MHKTLISRVYDGHSLPAMTVKQPVYKPPTAKQRGIQPNVTQPSQNQWFTKKEIAAHCITATKNSLRAIGKNWRDYCIVEPSAGDGRFYDFLPRTKRIGIDLVPQIDGIAKHDFLTWSPNAGGKYIVIGNPPFGVRGDLADAFIKRSCLFADICALILPIGYMDEQRSYFPGFEVIHHEELPGNSFVNILGHESKEAGQGAINTCLTIWSASNAPRPPVYDYVCNEYLRLNACNFPKDPTAFIESHDLFVKARYYGQTKISKNFDDVKSRRSHYVVGFGVDKNKRNYINKIQQIDWRNYQTKAMNGSFSITLKKARKALCDVGLARKITGHSFQAERCIAGRRWF